MGRRAKSPEVKALLGNPGKRKIALAKAADTEGETPPPAPKRAAILPPDYLTKDGEKLAFREVLAALPANLARKSDIHSIARWAVWLNVWVTAKLQLDSAVHWYESKSKHGTFLREHPISKRMHQAEAHLITLEDRLCLNITARHNIVHKMFNMPPAHPGEGLFGDEPIPADGKPAASGELPAQAPESPLGFLKDAGKQHKPETAH